MAARTPGLFTFQLAVDEGDYYRALGVPSDARGLDIDAAAARLVRRMPDNAHAISAVARVLTRRDAKAVYQSLCRLQAAVLRQLTTDCGSDCVDSFHGCRRLSWRKCCDLFHFNLNDTNLSIGPRGARSLAAEGRRWIVDSMLDSLLTRVVPTDAERHAGEATRELWYAACPRCGRCRLVACRRRPTVDSPAASFNSDNNAGHESLSSNREFWPSQYEFHLPLCRKCDVRLAEPSEYHQTYTFAVTERVTTACVVDLKWHFGHGDHSGFFDSFDVSHPPSYLKEFHTKQQQGNDVTLARTRYIAKRKPVLAVASTALVLPACLLLGFVMASVDDGKLGRPSNSQPRRKPGVTRPATPSFNDVMRKTAAIEFKLQLATMAAAKHPSDAKLQQMIARCYVELADVYSTSPVTRILATEFRHKALEILEGVVADNPNVPRLYGDNVVPDAAADDIASAGEVRSVLSTQRQHD